MIQPHATCRFCRGLGMSQEHIIAQWIGRAIDPSPIPGVDIVYVHRSENRETGRPLQEKRSKKPAFHTRAFCKACNSGWMARLEDAVRPILEPLVLGRRRALSVDDQQLLAFWATKTVLAFQTQEDDATAFARERDFTELHRLQAPLPTSQVWIGANRHGQPVWYQAHSIRLRGSAPDAVDGFGATLTVGHVVFYLTVGFAGRVGQRLRYAAATALKEIWPGRGRVVVWPPPLALQHDQPHGLPEYLAEHCVLVGA